MSSEYKEIVEMLLDATRQGRVAWVKDGYACTIRMPSFCFKIWEGESTDEGAIFAVDMMDRVMQTTIDSWYVCEKDPGFDTMRALFRAASGARGETRVEECLEDLRSMLKSGNRVGL